MFVTNSSLRMFRNKCKEYDIPVINYNINEIEDEFHQIKKDHMNCQTV